MRKEGGNEKRDGDALVVDCRQAMPVV